MAFFLKITYSRRDEVGNIKLPIQIPRFSNGSERVSIGFCNDIRVSTGGISGGEMGVVFKGILLLAAPLLSIVKTLQNVLFHSSLNR